MNHHIPGLSRGEVDALLSLSIHRWANGVAMNLQAAGLAQALAVIAEPLAELLNGFCSGRMDELLPAWPDVDQWKRCYRDHQWLTRELVGASPGLWPTGSPDPVQELRDLRGVSRMARDQPEETRQWLRDSVGNEKLAQMFRIGRRLQWRMYVAGLAERRSEMSEAWSGDDDEAAAFDRVLRESTPTYFFSRVVMPMVLVYGTTPQRELRAIRSSQNEGRRSRAVDRLVRVDPMASNLGEVRNWINVDDGFTRRARRGMVKSAEQAGIQTEQFKSGSVKSSVAGLIRVLVRQAGWTVNVQKGTVEPSDVRPAQLRDLARDRAGQPYDAAWCVDEDVHSILPNSWRQAVKRAVRHWEPIIASGA